MSRWGTAALAILVWEGLGRAVRGEELEDNELCEGLTAEEMAELEELLELLELEELSLDDLR